MLAELRVRDLAVIADVSLQLAPGFNVLSGETGAGKSLLVDALALLLGERASGDVVRPGADKAVVEGAFELSPPVSARLRPPLAELGVETDDGALVLKREVLPEGRSRAWVNGSPVAVNVLARVGELLVDLHGQHETQSLLRADVQRDLLDAFAGAALERAAVRDAHARLTAAERRESELRDREEEVRRKADYLRHVVEEVSRAAPRVGEDDALDAQVRRLAHAEELGRLCRDLEQAADPAPLGRAARLAAAIAKLDPAAGPWQELVDGADANLGELANAVRAYAAGLDTDTGRLAEAEQRRDVLYRLKQKHGPTIADVLARRDEAARELDLLDTAELDRRGLAEATTLARADFSRACGALTAKRSAASRRLSDEANALLAPLGMPDGRFGVSLSPLPAARSDGAETVSFDVQLNVGLEARPLSRVASGGELSRLMLALKVILAAHDQVPTLVFDEVDQGIGGEVASRVGDALARVAAGQRQVLVITHLAQIAARAARQFVVAKGAAGGVATSDVAAVEGEARRRELARMLGDADQATALAHAAELLKTAGATPVPPDGTPTTPARGRPRR